MILFGVGCNSLEFSHKCKEIDPDINKYICYGSEQFLLRIRKGEKKQGKRGMKKYCLLVAARPNLYQPFSS